MITKRNGTLGVFALLTFAALAACSDGPRNDLTAPVATSLISANSRGATTTTINESIFPFGFDSQGECGEIVRFSGTLHAVTHTTITSSGSIHAFVHFQPLGGVRAVGLTSGGQYVVPGMFHENFNLNGPGAAVTQHFVNNFQIIGAGSLPNFNLHQTFHITVNANGEITVVFDKAHAECR